jgi:yecA family protein
MVAYALFLFSDSGIIMAYSHINAILAKYAAGFSAAEAHGIATGLLCANSKLDSNHWLKELIETNSDIDDEQRDLLRRLFEETRQLLTSDDDFEFDLLLPDDEEPLIEKIIALKNWCQGFLFGIGSMSKQSNYSRDAQDILKDITEFTKLDTDTEEDEEEDEVALMELTEYLRSAILLLRDELQPNT